MGNTDSASEAPPHASGVQSPRLGNALPSCLLTRGHIVALIGDSVEICIHACIFSWSGSEQGKNCAVSALHVTWGGGRGRCPLCCFGHEKVPMYSETQWLQGLLRAPVQDADCAERSSRRGAFAAFASSFKDILFFFYFTSYRFLPGSTDGKRRHPPVSPVETSGQFTIRTHRRLSPRARGVMLQEGQRQEMQWPSLRRQHGVSMGFMTSHQTNVP